MSLGEIPELTLWQKLQLAVTGHVYVWTVKLEGHSAAVEVYVVKCPDHGLYLTRAHGFEGNLGPCPDCVNCYLTLADFKGEAFC